MEIWSNNNSIFNSISYIVEKCVLIDAGDFQDFYKSVSIVLLTHAHFDHIYGLNKVIEYNPYAKVYTNEFGRDMLLNAKKNLSCYHESDFVFGYPSQIVIVNDGDEIQLDKKRVAKAIFTPGHNPSCITWIIDDMIFTGDSFIPSVKTVTNLPGGNKPQAIESEQLILKLSEGKTIYPGHKV